MDHAQFAQDLRTLAGVLHANSVSLAARDIETASYALTKSDRNLVTFEVPNIDIKLDGRQRTMPDSVQLGDRLLVDISFEQDVSRSVDKDGLMAAITKNQINFKLDGLKKKKRLMCAWHFDRHTYAWANNAPAHPAFHIQFGGKLMRGISNDIQGVVILDTPRYFSPPLDPILAIDVLLSHFNGPTWNALRSNDPGYVEVVRRAQARLWLPYFLALVTDLGPKQLNTPAQQCALLPNLM